MELTIEQALQRGVAAHKEGSLQDAERLYRAILQAQPLHPDANHNLGVLAVSVNKADAALRLFKTAVEANPKVEQFWLSYIDALIKEKQFDNARKIIEQAKKKGAVGDKLNSLETRLTPPVQVNESKLTVQKKSLSLSQKRKTLAEQKKQKKEKKRKLKGINPSETQIKTLLTHYKTGQYGDAEKLAVSITQEFPKYPFSWKVLGAVLGATGRNSEAIDANQTAVALSPQDAAAHSNLGIRLQKLGRLDEAEASCRQAIALKSDFAEAHYELGITLQKLGKQDEALVSYTQAIVLKPDFAQVRSSLGNTLKELGRLDEALASYMQAIALKPDFAEAHYNLGVTLQELGRLDEALASYKQAIALKSDYAEPHSNLGVALKELGRLDEAEAYCRQAIALQSDFAETHSNLGNTLKELGRLDDAVASYTQATALKPDYAEAHYNLGVTLQQLAKLDEALASYKKAIALKPDFAKAHSNLGITLQELGRLGEAEASCRLAIALNPDFAAAHSNLGITLQELGRLDEAKVSYMQSIALRPDFADAHCNLGVTLKELGRTDEALASYTQAIALKPDYAGAYVNLGIALQNVKFNSSIPKLYPLLTQLLTAGNFTRPNDVVKSILSLLKHDNQIKHLLLEKNLAVSLNMATSIIESLDKHPLLHHLMRLCPLPGLQFEGLFVAVRSLLLKNLDKIEVSPKLIYFLSTLSMHCFTNEYVYIESDEETHLIGELQAKILQTLMQSEQPEAIKILCLASYRSLHQYDWCHKLESLDDLEEVKRRLIEEPLLEKMIAKDIPVWEEISDDVSLKVREQYEENPYPRWMKLGVSIKAKPIVAVCDELKLQLYSENIKNVTAPAILIAGCGTGQHSIGTASRFSNCHVTAVDLSLASLAYAQRKSNELRITNIDYFQADILHLHQVGKEFDIIESVGVLHHMDEPMAGWRVLVDLLKPGGLMLIGLYSELARQHIVEVRKEITALGVGKSEVDIRKFRHSLAESHDENHRRLTTSSDFFSLSTLRDLIFHVQEHRFTFSQIKNSLDELGLKFCGLANEDIISNFKKLHGNQADICDLELWHQFEEKNPRAFVGMYQFWCQKP
ncbi:tetratricopeptide repeat protein [Gammaproteobacteria bacterium]|nr:tetratricopeptide repeat protein [Gammaproteobacteria bacterium]